jgi:hypothetical protein
MDSSNNLDREIQRLGGVIDPWQLLHGPRNGMGWMLARLQTGQVVLKGPWVRRIPHWLNRYLPDQHDWQRRGGIKQRCTGLMSQPHQLNCDVGDTVKVLNQPFRGTIMAVLPTTALVRINLDGIWTRVSFPRNDLTIIKRNEFT